MTVLINPFRFGAGVAPSYTATVLADSPLVLVPLDDTTGTTAVALAGTNGTYTGGPTLNQSGPSSKIPAAIATDGVDDYMQVSYTGLGTAQPQTWEIWANANATINSSTTNRELVGAHNGVAFKAPMFFGSFGGGIAGEVLTIANEAAGAGDFTFWQSLSIAAGWHHHVITYSGTQGGWAYYIDGVSQGTPAQASGGAFGFTDGTITVGEYYGGYGQWQGAAMFAIYATQLSGARVADHYAAGL